MQLRHSGHSVYKTEYHLTFIPKYRRRLLNPGVAGYLSKLFPSILEEMPGVEIIEHNIQLDHIHMVLIIPPKYAVATVVGKLKHHTASLLRKKFAHLSQVNRRKPIICSEGYFVSTIGLNESQIIEYVRFKERQDLGQAKLELAVRSHGLRPWSLTFFKNNLLIVKNFFCPSKIWFEPICF